MYRYTKYKISDEVLVFPAMFEVRFAEHLLASIKAILMNMEACREVWREVAETGTRTEKAEESGFLKKWAPDGRTLGLTALMADVCTIYCHLQKALQRGDLVLPEVREARNAALLQLEMMTNGPLPGGEEEKLGPGSDETPAPRHNTNVTSKRSVNAVRNEVVGGATNFLQDRLDVEQEAIVKTMVELLQAPTAKQLVSASRSLASGLFGAECVTQLTADVCDSWTRMSSERETATDR